MSISIRGKLRIKRINGSNGPFCVGDLETEIGEFRVKDAVLDQFDEGLYAGQFWIQQIYPWSYSSYGRMVIEIRAKLSDLQIEGQQRASTSSRELQEPDPAFDGSQPAAPKDSQPAPPAEQPASSGNPSAPGDNNATAPATVQDSPSVGEEPDLKLFGPELYPLVAVGEPVKLDPTIDRIQFRKQRHRLKEELDYEFKSADQTWYPPGHPDR
jgi:hypothetical protein